VDSIELDIARTKYALGANDRDALRHVLRAFAGQRPDVGYCQGMNNIVATFLLLGFGETTALNGLCHVVDILCPGYHSEALVGYHRDVLVLDALVQKILPERTQKRLEMLNVPLSVLAVEHFLTLGSASWPPAAVARLWDLIFLEGQPALFASFLALLSLYLPKAVSAPSPKDGCGEDPVQAFRHAAAHGVATDSGMVLRHTRELLRHLSSDDIDHHRCVLADTIGDRV
jgi:hypothetical protein